MAEIIDREGECHYNRKSNITEGDLK